MLDIKSIDTYYGDFHVLKEISFFVRKKEIVVLLGANGHGKSTILKTVCGLISPSSGVIELNGTPIQGLPIYKIVDMGLVYVPEERHLFPDLTVNENLLLGAYIPRARKVKDKNFRMVFELFPRLQERKDQIASTLSGGERQMLALGRGLMSSAQLMAIDEPSVGLAPILKKGVFDKIKEINEQQDLTIILVEQDVESSLAISSRGYVIKDGKIVYDDEAGELSVDIIQKQYLM